VWLATPFTRGEVFSPEGEVAGAAGVAVGTQDSLATTGAAVGWAGRELSQNRHGLPAQPPSAIIVSEATASIENLVPSIGTLHWLMTPAARV
jgi:hypothetical protein